MKKPQKTTIFKSIITGFCFLTAACNGISPATQRVNPTPAPVISAAPVKVSSKFSSLPPIPVESIMPTAVPVDLSKFTFDVDVKFDGLLGRVYIDDGEYRDTSARYVLQGGRHVIVVFDLVTYCRIAKEYIIDKNMVIEYTLEKDC